MGGVFRLGDRLLLEPLRIDEVRKGDVLVYRRTNDKGQEEFIVHRAVRTTNRGIIVQGDYNRLPDTVLVIEETLVGRVSQIKRKGKTIQVQGGLIGHMRAQIFRRLYNFSRWADYRFRQVGRIPYVWLRQTKLIGYLWQPEVKRLRFMSKGSSMTKYVIRNRTVATYRQETMQLDCKKPYDLVIWPDLNEIRD